MMLFPGNSLALLRLSPTPDWNSGALPKTGGSLLNQALPHIIPETTDRE